MKGERGGAGGGAGSDGMMACSLPKEMGNCEVWLIDCLFLNVFNVFFCSIYISILIPY